MSTILDALANTLCLHMSGTSMKVSESRHKLEGTFVYFQGVPIRLDLIHGGDGFRYSQKDGRSFAYTLDHPIGVDSIKPFDLESGVYIISGVPIEITRKVKKIYKKSFSPDAYIFDCLDPMALDKFHSHFTYFCLFGLKRQTIYQYKDKIYYGRKAIGSINPDKTLKVSSLFTNEVQEAIWNGTIKIQ